MFECPLSYNERLTLYGLVRYPLLNDRELSQKLGLKMTTLTSIKNRLKAGDFFQTIRYPTLMVLDMELLVVKYGRFDPSADHEKCKQMMEEHENWAHSSIFSLIEGPNFLSLSLHKNYTQTKKEMYHFETAMHSAGLGEMSEIDYFILPLTDGNIRLLFDYGILMERTLDLPLDELPKDEGDSVDYVGTTETISLKSAESKVLFGLVQDPDIPDSSVAKRIGLTRQAVSRMKRKFEVGGLMGTSRVPDIKKLGYEILVFTHYYHEPTMDAKAIHESLQVLIDNMCTIYVSSNATESCFIGVAKDFSHYQLMKNAIHSSTLELEGGGKEPNTMLFSIPSMEFVRTFNFLDFLGGA